MPHDCPIFIDLLLNSRCWKRDSDIASAFSKTVGKQWLVCWHLFPFGAQTVRTARKLSEEVCFQEISIESVRGRLNLWSDGFLGYDKQLSFVATDCQAVAITDFPFLRIQQLQRKKKLLSDKKGNIKWLSSVFYDQRKTSHIEIYFNF